MRRWRQVRASVSWWDLVFVLCLLIVGALRFSILRSGGAPPTIDSGNWLAFADSMLGSGARSSSIVYPPLVPLLASAFVALFGLVDGVSLLGALAATMPAIGIYAALRYLGHGLGAFVPGLLLLGASSVGEATAWGGFPQLIGFGLTPIVLVAVDRWLRTWSNRAALIAGALFALVMAVSHFVAFVVGLAVAAMGLMALFRPISPDRDWRKGLQSAAVFVIPMLPLVPLYLSLGGVFFGPSPSATTSGQFAWSELPEQLEFLYRAFPWLWRSVFVAAVVAPLVGISRRDSALWRILVALLIAVAGVSVLMREGRFLYFMTVVGGLGIAVWVEYFVVLASHRNATGQVRSRQRWLAAGSTGVLLLLCLWQVHAGLRFFDIQRNHYGVLNPGLVAAIDYVGTDSTPSEVVAIPSLNDAPVGWWVEAISDRAVIYGSPLRWLMFDSELERAAIANQIFAPRFPTDQKLDLAVASGISYIVIPTNWTFYEADAVAELGATSPWSVVYSNDDAVVLKLLQSS